jgi:ribosomal protein S18 acetylase RimI-like enzyme
MLIRPYRDADQGDVVALWHEVFAYPTPHNDPEAVIRQKRAVQPELFLVAELDDRVVGTVLGGYDGHRGWVYSLAVAPARRGLGIGTALVRHLERALAGRACPKVNLQVLASNAGVVAFYEKLGYRVEDRISMGKVF